MTPLLFAKALRQAMDYRLAGMERNDAALQACSTVGIDRDWALVIHLTLDGSSALALAWIDEQIMKNLDVKSEGEFR